MMHPYLREQLAADHMKAMYAEAAAQRLAKEARRVRRASRAQRDGVGPRLGLRMLWPRPRVAGPAAPAPDVRTHETIDPVGVGDQAASARERAA